MLVVNIIQVNKGKETNATKIILSKHSEILDVMGLADAGTIFSDFKARLHRRFLLRSFSF